MSERGRPRKPTKLRLLQGNPGKRPINQNEPKPKPRTKDPSPPDTLSAVGRKEWRRTARELLAVGLLTDLDMAAFQGYCHIYERWADAEANLRQYGAVIRTKKTQTLVHSPYWSVANKAWDQMRAFWSDFGMTPVARTRIDLTTVEEDDFTEWMFRGK